MGSWDDFDAEPPAATSSPASEPPPTAAPPRRAPAAVPVREVTAVELPDGEIIDDGVQYIDDVHIDFRGPDNAYALPDPTSLLSIQTPRARDPRRPLGQPDDSEPASPTDKRAARIAARQEKDEEKRQQRESAREARTAAAAQRKAQKKAHSEVYAEAPPRRSRKPVLIGLAVVAVLAVGIWGVTFLRSSPPPSADTATTAPTQSANSTPRATTTAPTTVLPSGPPAIDSLGVDCPANETRLVTTGRDGGGFVGGPAVIQHFQYGYYVARSGRVAREVVQPGAAVGSEATLDASIARLPQSTKHCLQITDRGNGEWGVQLVEVTPTQRTVYPQIVRTVEENGRTWIVSVQADKSGA